MDQPEITPRPQQEAASVVSSFPRMSKKLFGRKAEGLLKEIREVVLTKLEQESDKEAPSARGVRIGLRCHPYNYSAIYEMLESNPYHSACLSAKVQSTVGLGFESEADRKRKRSKKLGVPLEELPPAEEEVAKIDTVLNPLCTNTWRDTLTSVTWDIYNVGIGYLEVVRASDAPNAPITGIHHVAAKDLHVYVEDDRAANWHYMTLHDESGGGTAFARFGDLSNYLARANRISVPFTIFNSGKKVTEIIPIRNPTARDRFYGGIDWLAAVAAIELSQMLTQHSFDFFLNRAVPEFIMFLIGASLDKTDREKIERGLDCTVGLGNQRKTMMVTLDNPEAKAQIEKLAMESKGDGSQYANDSEAAGSQIVTAHGVPPLLAGIQIPGKLGAANETVQAMQLFQVLKIGPTQEIIMQALRSTLGDARCNGGLDLNPATDFTLNTILDEIDVAKADTVARMRQSPQEAEAEGRDIDQGLKD